MALSLWSLAEVALTIIDIPAWDFQRPDPSEAFSTGPLYSKGTTNDGVVTLCLTALEMKPEQTSQSQKSGCFCSLKLCATMPSIFEKCDNIARE
ncbi:hypothetical protein STEG23_002255, partial [Scotinomys teguina]